MKGWFRRLLIPNKENKYAPHSLQTAAVGGMLALILLTFTLTNVHSLLWMASEWMVSTILPAVIVEETNEERADDNLPILRRNSTLDAAAKLKAEHMANNEYFAHYSPDGVSPWYWFSQAGYNFVHAGENLAIHFTDSSEIVEAWMDSPTHRANIMNGNYTEIGIGTAQGTYDGFSTVYVVQLFGTPAAAAPSVAGDEMAVAPVETPTVVSDTAAEPTGIDSEPVTEDTVVLADEASIEETVEIIPAEPVLVTRSDVSATDSMPTTTPTTSRTIVEDTVVTDTGVALYSDFISTSTGGIPASIDPTTPVGGDGAPVVLSVLTQPHVVLQLMYAIIGLFVLVSLVLSIFIEIRHQQPLQIAYGVALLMLMSGLFYVHTLLTGGVMIA